MRKQALSYLICFFVLAGLSLDIEAQQDAFPGAEGFGLFASGGRGGQRGEIIRFPRGGGRGKRLGIGLRIPSIAFLFQLD